MRTAEKGLQRNGSLERSAVSVENIFVKPLPYLIRSVMDFNLLYRFEEHTGEKPGIQAVSGLWVYMKLVSKIAVS